MDMDVDMDTAVDKIMTGHQRYVWADEWKNEAQSEKKFRPDA